MGNRMVFLTSLVSLNPLLQIDPLVSHFETNSFDFYVNDKFLHIISWFILSTIRNDQLILCLKIIIGSCSWFPLKVSAHLDLRFWKEFEHIETNRSKNYDFIYHTRFELIFNVVDYRLLFDLSAVDSQLATVRDVTFKDIKQLVLRWNMREHHIYFLASWILFSRNFPEL